MKPAPIAVVSFAAALATLAFFRLPFSYQAITFFVTLTFPSLFLYSYAKYLEEKRLKELEARLPDALFQVASFPAHTPLEEAFKAVAESGYGELSKEFAAIVRQVDAGKGVAKALQEAKAKTKSRAFARTLTLLSSAYGSGADLGKAYRDVAEDVFDFQLLEKEKAAAQAMQKYTLIFGGAVLVPIVLGLLLSTVSSLDFGDDALFGLPQAERVQLLDAVLLGNQLYLGIFCVMASAFIASSEGSKRKAVIYASILLPTALLLFNLARGFSALG